MAAEVAPMIGPERQLTAGGGEACAMVTVAKRPEVDFGPSGFLFLTGRIPGRRERPRFEPMPDVFALLDLDDALGLRRAEFLESFSRGPAVCLPPKGPVGL